MNEKRVQTDVTWGKAAFSAFQVLDFFNSGILGTQSPLAGEPELRNGRAARALVHFPQTYRTMVAAG